MKTMNYFKMTTLLLCIGTTAIFGQSKIQKEKDEKETVFFAKIDKDTTAKKFGDFFALFKISTIFAKNFD